MSDPQTENRERLRSKMIENAVEINRLHRRIHETVKNRDQSDALHEEWTRACTDFHARYGELCLPGGPHLDFYERLRAGDSEMIEVALCFLELRPYFFRSGYHWKTILRKCRQAPMSEQQSDRYRLLAEKYSEWKKLRRESAERGAAVAQELWPLRRRFHNLFPIKIANHKFDGLVTVGDLYRLLCSALKVEPLVDPETHEGKVRSPCRAIPDIDMATWAREYGAWRESAWPPEDVWATLESIIRDVYGLDAAFEVSPDTVLRLPK
jgi:hypothetical protein